MTKQELAQELLVVVDEIGKAEEQLVKIETRRREHEFTLKDQEARLLASENSVITGKNAETRSAQVFSLTGPERVLLLDLEVQVSEAKAALNRARALHRSLLAIAAMVAGSPDSEYTNG